MKRRKKTGDPSELVSLHGVSCGYRGRPVLRDVNVRIEPGQLWFFLGDNGSGKSTLLKVLLGLLSPSAGRRNATPGAVRIGFVPQHSTVRTSLPTTVREFVDLGFVGLRIGADERKRTLAACLETVGLAGREHDDLRSLSGGTRQRALLARALVRNPNLLLLDEPTNHLDLAAERDFIAMLKKLNETRGMSVVFVTHDEDIARTLASHVAVFHDGTVDAGPAASVLSEYELERRLPTGRTAHPHDRPGPGDGNGHER